MTNLDDFMQFEIALCTHGITFCNHCDHASTHGGAYIYHYHKPLKKSYNINVKKTHTINSLICNFYGVFFVFKNFKFIIHFYKFDDVRRRFSQVECVNFDLRKMSLLDHNFKYYPKVKISQTYSHCLIIIFLFSFFFF
jgi:hypothetical protein